jgi:gamma-glutamyltranspeptidase/glutathione hydrolase
MSESAGAMMAESGMPANPYHYWTRHPAFDVLAAVNKAGPAA